MGKEYNIIELEITKQSPVFIKCRKLFFCSISNIVVNYTIYPLSFFIGKKQLQSFTTKPPSFTPINYILKPKTKDTNHKFTEDFPNGWFDFGDKEVVVEMRVDKEAPEDYKANIILKTK